MSETIGLDDKLPGCDCPDPHTVRESVIPRLLRDLRDAKLRENEEIDAVALFVRSWLDMRAQGIWR